MSLLYVMLLILLFIIFLVFSVALKIAFTLDTKQEGIRLLLFWLYPLFKITAEGSITSPQVSVYFFKKMVYSGIRAVRKQAGSSTGLIKAVSVSDIRIDTDYGFRDPFVTGITCGSISAVSESVNAMELRQNPDFMSDEDYIRLDATAKVNIGNTILNYFKEKAKPTK